MLILSRKAQQAIHIGSNVRVVVIATGKGSVRIGIEAPEEVDILRDEIWQTRKTFQEPGHSELSSAIPTESTRPKADFSDRQEVLPFFEL